MGSPVFGEVSNGSPASGDIPDRLRPCKGGERGYVGIVTLTKEQHGIAWTFATLLTQTFSDDVNHLICALDDVDRQFTVGPDYFTVDLPWYGPVAGRLRLCETGQRGYLATYRATKQEDGIRLFWSVLTTQPKSEDIKYVICALSPSRLLTAEATNELRPPSGN